MNKEDTNSLVSWLGKILLTVGAAWVGWVHTSIIRLGEDVARIGLGYNKTIAVGSPPPRHSLFAPEDREKTFLATPMIFQMFLPKGKSQ